MISTTIEPTKMIVDRTPGLSQKAFIENYLNKGIPVVIPGAMKEWKAFSKWEPAYFRDTHIDKLVIEARKKLLLWDFMNSVYASSESNPSYYLNEVNIHNGHFRATS